MAKNAPGLHLYEGISLIQLFKLFPDDDRAERWFIKTRWPDGNYACPRCGSVNVKMDATHPTMPHRCRDCVKYFSVKTGTVMEHSRLGYQTWIIAIYLFLTNLKGVSSMKMHRDLDVTQRTAWYLLHRIRHSVCDTAVLELKGVVEVDETYIGGKATNRPRHKRTKNWMDHKTPIVGMKHRKTNQVRTEVVVTADTNTLTGFVQEHVRKGATVYTDGSNIYNSLASLGFNHDTVIHSKEEYARGDVTTNGIESFWSLVKRGYMGVYHWMSEKHLPKYAAEFTYRHNIRRKDTIDQMKAVALEFEGARLLYRQLVC